MHRRSSALTHGLSGPSAEGEQGFSPLDLLEWKHSWLEEKVAVEELSQCWESTGGAVSAGSWYF